MFHLSRATGATALICAAVMALLTGCDEGPNAGLDSLDSSETESNLFTGTQKIEVNGKSVNVSCTGNPVEDKPAIMLLLGFGDGLEAMGDLQKSLSAHNRVCSYDRLGEGASDQPDAPQDFASNGQILTAVLDKAMGEHPVVLAGHSMGGLLAARYAPDHQDRVVGLVLLDATGPTAIADTLALLPEGDIGPAAAVREQMIAMREGANPEQLRVQDGEVRAAGDIPVQVVQHGRQDLAAIPQYGPDLERIWAEGQRKWLALSSRSTLVTATRSGHYIYRDEPDLAIQAIERVTTQAAEEM
ncbi:alpha/beta hydrolase [Saccharopolyspora subtropica]|uniref:Alpha/beta hydrolase n=1 Tax=Saccharopolyspora thermophila TaxID=89367 RepID=A0A917KAE1_9PSEU|nr:alpha/beta hydrolase [Saccharopolyspora subtropica]GGJ05256.1 alpha/beta hydrolase [Saccharopolyspora subtropica]